MFERNDSEILFVFESKTYSKVSSHLFCILRLKVIWVQYMSLTECTGNMTS